MRWTFAPFLAVLLVTSTSAEPPQLINFQGRLVDGGGPMNGLVTLVLRIYTNALPTGGESLLYEDSGSVTAVDGLYVTFLGDGTTSGSLLTALNQSSNLYIETVVNGTTLSPRERLASAAFSLATREILVDSNQPPNVVLLPSGNSVSTSARGAAIGGGGPSVISAHADYSTIGGGGDNSVGTNAWFASIGGGFGNEIRANSPHSIIDGGANNVVARDSPQSTIGGGEDNTLDSTLEGLGSHSVIAGGFKNKLLGGTYDVVSGGASNYLEPSGVARTLGGGQGNFMGFGSFTTLGGGYRNLLDEDSDTALIGGGAFNEISSEAYASTLGGGRSNFIGHRAAGSFLGGGVHNSIGLDATNSVLLGGTDNSIGTNSQWSVVVGGSSNRVANLARHATISGGRDNEILSGSSNAVISGGEDNHISLSNFSAVVAGGSGNYIESKSERATISGGRFNLIRSASEYSTISGGDGNQVATNSPYAAIGGGKDSWVGHHSPGAVVAGGSGNEIGDLADYSVIGGGSNNTVRDGADFATIPGGQNNVVSNDYTFAAGRRAHALHQGSFVWADSQNADFSSSGNDQFVIRAAGGVGINRENPNAALDVEGRIRVRGTNDAIGTAAPGIFFYDHSNVADRAFAGLVTPSYVGFFGFPGNIFGLRMNIYDGSVGIRMNPLYDFDVNGVAHKSDNSAFWYVASDRRLKTDIGPITNGLALINRVRPSHFHYRPEVQAAHPGLPSTLQVGVIAQDFEEVFPDSVKTNAEGYLALDGSPLMYVSVAAIQELHRMVLRQQEQIRALEEKLKGLPTP